MSTKRVKSLLLPPIHTCTYPTGTSACRHNDSMSKRVKENGDKSVEKYVTQHLWVPSSHQVQQNSVRDWEDSAFHRGKILQILSCFWDELPQNWKGLSNSTALSKPSTILAITPPLWRLFSTNENICVTSLHCTLKRQKCYYSLSSLRPLSP